MNAIKSEELTKEEREKQQVIDEETRQRIRELNKGQRLTLAPPLRITLAGIVGGGYGLISGFYRGFQHSALQYLAENAHRMPTTKGGWYFYHKRKNYVVIKDGMVRGLKQGTKFGVVAAAYFSVEAYIDHLRGVIDFGSTVVASGVAGYVYGASLKLSSGQAFRQARAFMIFGAVSGLLQDAMLYKRGNEVWYLRWAQAKMAT